MRQFQFLRAVIFSSFLIIVLFGISSYVVSADYQRTSYEDKCPPPDPGESSSCCFQCMSNSKAWVWDGRSEYPDCGCTCVRGFYVIEGSWPPTCGGCNMHCYARDVNSEWDEENSGPNEIVCKCKQGFEKDKVTGMCEPARAGSTSAGKTVSPCPTNATLIKTGGYCGDDRKVNSKCCCDVNYVAYAGNCLLPSDIPGREIICGKWGCQKGENCFNCPADCGCIGGEVCDPFSEYANMDTKCSPKVALILVSSDLSYRHLAWALSNAQKQRARYQSMGYMTITQYVTGMNDIAKHLAKPSSRALAYYGEARYPSLEDTAPGEVKSALYTEMNKKYRTLVNATDAKRIATARSNSPNLDEAYIYTCYSLLNTSLADYLVRPGGTYYGSTDTYWPTESLEQYIRP